MQETHWNPSIGSMRKMISSHNTNDKNKLLKVALKKTDLLHGKKQIKVILDITCCKQCKQEDERIRSLKQINKKD